MNRFLDFLLDQKIALLLAFFCLGYVALNLVESHVLITDKIYSEMLSEKFDDRIVNEMVETRNNSMDVAMDLFFLVLQKCFLWLLLTVLLYAGLVAFNLKMSLGALSKIVLIASYAFLISYGIKILWFALVDSDFTMHQYTDFYPLSLYSFGFDIGGGALSDFLKYANLFEVLFIVVLGLLTAKVTGKEVEPSLKFSALSYVSILVVFILIKAFINLTLA